MPPHLFPFHEALLFPEVHMVDGETLLCPRLEGNSPVRPRHHTALPTRHLWQGRDKGKGTSVCEGRGQNMVSALRPTTWATKDMR